MGLTPERIGNLITCVAGAASGEASLPAAAAAVRLTFDFDWLVLYLTDHHGRLLLAAEDGDPPKNLELPDRIDPGEGVVGRAFATSAAVPLRGRSTGFALPVGPPEHTLGVLAATGPGRDQRARAETAAELLGTVASRARAWDQLRRENDRNRAESARQREAEQTKDRFISAVSHEFRTPLTSIRSFSEILLTHSPDDPETAREFISIIHEESMRLSRLVNNLLDLSKMQAGRMEWDFRENRLSDAIRRATKSVTSVTAEREIRIEVDCPEEIPDFSFDLDKVIQVLVNLLSNAVKFSPRGGTVVIRAEPAGGGVHVHVLDSGPGIAAEDRMKVFDRFTRVGSAPREHPGTGLGLSISREIVLAHGGSIGVDEAPGGGSDFHFELPPRPKPERLGVPTEEPDPATSPSPREVDPSGCRVLVVDDDPNFRRFLLYELRQAGFAVLESDSALVGLETIRAEHPDLVLLDLNLPDLSGTDLLAILDRDPDTTDLPVIVISVAPVAESVRFLPPGRILQKPLDSSALLTRVTQVLGEAGG